MNDFIPRLRAWRRAVLASAILAVCGTLAAQAEDTVVSEGQMNDEELGTILFQAQEGDTIALPGGRYSFGRPLKLTVANVTITGRGSGADPANATILSFKGASEGNGFEVRFVKGVTLRNFAVEDAVGNGVFVTDSSDVVIEAVRAEWTTDPQHSSLMAYGIYPVASDNVLITNSKAIGAHDAGLYVGQSMNVRVVGNEVYSNVAGIEIENSRNTIVEDNDIHDNSGGVLVFALPGTFRFADNEGTIVRNNTVIGNNRPIADTAAGFVLAVPPGTGVMVMAAQNTEVTGNTITNHDTTGVLAISFLATGFAFDPAVYDPYLRGLSVHGNTITEFGDQPGGTFADPAGLAPVVTGMFASLEGMGLPPRLTAVIWDGIVDPSTGTTGAQGNGGAYREGQQICSRGNIIDVPVVANQMSYENLDFDLLALMQGLAAAPIFPFPPRLDCEITLPPVTGLP
jgi:parallel beta-helix repeat protein